MTISAATSGLSCLAGEGEEVATDSAVDGSAIVGEEAGEAGGFEAGDGEEQLSAVGLIGFPNEEVVAGDELTEVVGEGEWFGGTAGGLAMNIRQSHEGGAIDDERTGAVDDHLLAGFADDFDGGLPVAGFAHGDGDVDAGVGGWGGDADFKAAEGSVVEAVALQVADLVVLDENEVAAVVESVPGAAGAIDRVTGTGATTRNVVG